MTLLEIHIFELCGVPSPLALFDELNLISENRKEAHEELMSIVFLDIAEFLKILYGFFALY